MLGKELRELREDAGITQLQMAQRLGYTSPQFISNIERGVSSLPDDQIKRIARLLRADPVELAELKVADYRRWLIARVRR